MQIAASDIIAMLLLVLCFILKILQFDGVVDSAMLLVVGYYFGKQTRLISQQKT